jgi:hypothetical protein
MDALLVHLSVPAGSLHMAAAIFALDGFYVPPLLPGVNGQMSHLLLKRHMYPMPRARFLDLICS